MESQARDHERKAAATSGQEALDHAIAAAELYMQALRRASTPRDRASLGRKCNEMLALAERWKQLSLSPDPPGPKSTRPLTTAEKIILLRASKLHGRVFPPWEAPPPPSGFAKSGDDMFLDEFPYSFSPAQKRLFSGWKRPLELFSELDVAGDRVPPEDLMGAGEHSDLVQDMLTDCSVVASLCAAMRHLRQKQGSLLASLMYPFDYDAFRPALSENGKYVFRMLFNGCFRQVVVDDRLPSSSASSRALFVVDQRNPRLVWPALMEKAYLKIRGGYDFPGSNSGTDLYVLTGWIPEQVFVRDDETDLDRVWTAMKTAYDEEHVIVTLGTAFLTPEEEESLGLVSEHDYAVLDVDERDGARRMLVKNPWRNSVVWKGVGSSSVSVDVVTSSPSLPTNSGSSAAGEEEEEATEDRRQTGTFWMPFEDVVQNFSSLYLNWNPALFRYRQDHHFSWDIPSGAVLNALTRNPQFSIRPTASSPVWVLLSRHWQDDELEILRNGRYKNGHHRNASVDDDSINDDDDNDNDDHDIPAAQRLAAVSQTLGFMSLGIYASSPPGTRIALADRSALARSTYVDCPNTLLRFEDPTPGRSYTLVVTQVDLPLPRYSFTLSFLSTAPLDVAPAPEPLPHAVELSGSWTRWTAGGNTDSPTYHMNPQFAISVPASPASGTRLSLLLVVEDPDLPVHVSLRHSGGGQRVTGPANRRDVIASSPEYRRGAAATTPGGVLVAPGRYTVVVSTFEPGCRADFVLRVASDQPVAAELVPPEGAGLFRTDAAPLRLDDDDDDADDNEDPGVSEGLRAAGGSIASVGRRAAAVPTAAASKRRAPITLERTTKLGVIARTAGQALELGGGVGGATAASRLGSSVRQRSTAWGGIDGSSGTATPTPCAVRASLELGRSGPRRRELAVTGDGEFADAAGAGLRTAYVHVDPATAAAAGGLWLVVEWVGRGSSAAARGVAELYVDVLSDVRLQIGDWQVVDD